MSRGHRYIQEKSGTSNHIRRDAFRDVNHACTRWLRARGLSQDRFQSFTRQQLAAYRISLLEDQIDTPAPQS
jgi:hypothetical protein